MFGPVYGYGTASCGFIGLFIAILIVGILFYVMKNHKKDIGSAELNNDPQMLSVLKERLAKGDITTEEFKRIKETINK